MIELTKEQYITSVINHRKAWKYFGLDNSEPYKYALHHKDQSLKYNDIDRYIEWRPEDLEVMTFIEHNKLHNQGENNPMYGKHHTEEWKKKHSERMKGEGNPNYGKPTAVKGLHWKLVDGKRVYYK